MQPSRSTEAPRPPSSPNTSGAAGTSNDSRTSCTAFAIGYRPLGSLPRRRRSRAGAAPSSATRGCGFGSARNSCSMRYRPWSTLYVSSHESTFRRRDRHAWARHTTACRQQTNRSKSSWLRSSRSRTSIGSGGNLALRKPRRHRRAAESRVKVAGDHQARARSRTPPIPSVGGAGRFYDQSMSRLAERASIAFALLAATSMTVVVATAPNGYPTPSDGVWGRDMPNTQGAVSFALLGVSALLFATAAVLRVRRRRPFVGTATWIASSVILLLLNIVIWRLHAPVSAGNGG